MRWFTGFRPPRTETAPFPGDGLDALGLLAVLEEALAHLDATEQLLAHCADGRVGPAEARQSLRLRVTFTRLSHWVDGMRCPSVLLPARDETACLLRFYLLMVTSAMDAVYAPASRQHIALRGGRGATGEQLLALRDAVRDAVG